MNLQSADHRQWVLSFLSYELCHKKTFFFDVSGDVQTDYPAVYIVELAGSSCGPLAKWSEYLHGL